TLDADEMKLRDLGRAATFRVTFRQTLTLLGRPTTGTRTIYQRGANAKREDVTLHGKTTRYFDVNGVSIVCGYDVSGSCARAADLAPPRRPGDIGRSDVAGIVDEVSTLTAGTQIAPPMSSVTTYEKDFNGGTGPASSARTRLVTRNRASLA